MSRNGPKRVIGTDDKRKKLRMHASIRPTDQVIEGTCPRSGISEDAYPKEFMQNTSNLRTKKERCKTKQINMQNKLDDEA